MFCSGVDYFNPTFVAPQLTPKQCRHGSLGLQFGLAFSYIRDNGKENGNYYIKVIQGLYLVINGFFRDNGKWTLLLWV